MFMFEIYDYRNDTEILDNNYHTNSLDPDYIAQTKQIDRTLHSFFPYISAFFLNFNSAVVSSLSTSSWMIIN